MSVIYGVQFNPVPGFLYAPESNTPGEPGVFGTTTEFPRDKDGNYFVTNFEYRYYTKSPAGDVYPLPFELDAFGTVIPTTGWPDGFLPPVSKSQYLNLNNPVTGEALLIKVLPNGDVQFVNGDGGAQDLNGVLTQGNLPGSRIGNGSAGLQEGPETSVDGAPSVLPSWDLWKKVNGVLTRLFRVRLNSDNTVGMTYNENEVINYDSTTVRFSFLTSLFSGFIRATGLGLTAPTDITNPDSLAAFVTDNATSSNVLGRINKTDLAAWLKSSILAWFVDLVARSLTLTNLSATSSPPNLFLVPVQQPGGGWKVMSATVADMVSALLPGILPYIPTGTTGGGSSRQPVLAGCALVDDPPDMRQEVVMDQLTPGTWVTHNLQTTSDNIGVEQAYTYNAAVADHWVRDTNVDSLLQFNGTDQVRLPADATGYGSVKLKFILKRMIPI